MESAIYPLQHTQAHGRQQRLVLLWLTGQRAWMPLPPKQHRLCPPELQKLNDDKHLVALLSCIQTSVVEQVRLYQMLFCALLNNQKIFCFAVINVIVTTRTIHAVIYWWFTGLWRERCELHAGDFKYPEPGAQQPCKTWNPDEHQELYPHKHGTNF